MNRNMGIDSDEEHHREGRSADATVQCLSHGEPPEEQLQMHKQEGLNHMLDREMCWETTCRFVRQRAW